MPSKPLRLSDKAHLPFKTANKHKRQELHIKQKKARDAIKRGDRFARKKLEERDPKVREARLTRNVPHTIDSKRIYDEIDNEPEDGGLGRAYDVAGLKRRKLAEEQNLELGSINSNGEDEDKRDSDVDSMLDDSDSDSAQDSDVDEPALVDEAASDPLPSTKQLANANANARRKERGTSPPKSTTSTNLSLAPAALAAKFPTLFINPSETDPETPLSTPKILITTSINSTLHREANLLTNLIPNSKYIRRSSHRYGYKFSVREISQFAQNQDYTSVIVLEEHLKKPAGLTVVHLPVGPTFHFSITNWYDGKSIPGHGRATSHVPELILQGFSTPLGLLTAHLLKSLFPPAPELEGRQVITFHNQRDFIFLRRYRYVVRNKRETEKAVVGPDGRPMTGAEEVRAGLQELGPRLTLKLRRVDKGIQRASGQEWEWKGKTDRVRTKFQL